MFLSRANTCLYTAKQILQRATERETSRSQEIIDKITMKTRKGRGLHVGSPWSRGLTTRLDLRLGGVNYEKLPPAGYISLHERERERERDAEA